MSNAIVSPPPLPPSPPANAVLNSGKAASVVGMGATKTVITGVIGVVIGDLLFPKPVADATIPPGVSSGGNDGSNTSGGVGQPGGYDWDAIGSSGLTHRYHFSSIKYRAQYSYHTSIITNPFSTVYSYTDIVIDTQGSSSAPKLVFNKPPGNGNAVRIEFALPQGIVYLGFMAPAKGNATLYNKELDIQAFDYTVTVLPGNEPASTTPDIPATINPAPNTGNITAIIPTPSAPGQPSFEKSPAPAASPASNPWNIPSNVPTSPPQITINPDGTINVPGILDPGLAPLIPAIVGAPGNVPSLQGTPYNPKFPGDTPNPNPSQNPVQPAPKPCNPASGCGAKAEQTINNNNQQINNLTNQLQALDLSLLAVINNKLGTPITNGGLGGATGRLFNQLKVDRILNIISTITVLHNAVMLSRDLTETLGSTVDTVANAAGFQFEDAEGAQVGFTDVIGGTVLNWAIAIFGEEDVRIAILAWKKANRMYQAGANIIDSVRQITESARAISELTVERVSVIGNALRESSVVLQDAYDQFEEEFNGVSRFSRAFDQFEQGVSNVSEALESIEQVASEVISVQESLEEIKNLKDEFKENQQALRDIAKEEYNSEQAQSEVGDIKINNYSFAKEDD